MSTSASATAASEDGFGDSEIVKLRKENKNLKKQLTQTEKELNDAYGKLGGIVQKQSLPKDEMERKYEKLEAALAEANAEKATTDERIQRLQSINSSMQQVFDEKADKIKLEADAERQKLKLEIAQLNT